jgi:hypothetical protein
MGFSKNTNVSERYFTGFHRIKQCFIVLTGNKESAKKCAAKTIFFMFLPGFGAIINLCIDTQIGRALPHNYGLGMTEIL